MANNHKAGGSIGQGSIHSVLRRFGEDIGEARRRYEAFIGDGLRSGQWEDFYQIRDRTYLGNDRFVAELKEKNGEAADTKILCRDLNLEDLIQAASERFQVDVGAVRALTKERHASRAREAIVYVARRTGIATTTRLAQELRRDPSAISRMMRRMESPEKVTEMDEFIKQLAATNKLTKVKCQA